MPSKKLTLEPGGIDDLIREIRGQRVILDSDLARVYGVPTFRFNEAIKRNKNRFPSDFMFQLDEGEFEALKSHVAMSETQRAANSSRTAMSSTKQASLTSQFAILKTGRGRHRKYRPYAFTEHGAIMAANILRSPRAVQMSVFVIRAFVKMRETLLGTRELAKKLAALEKQLTGRLDSHEAAIVHVLQELMLILNPPPPTPPPQKPRIGFSP
jgi:phage regulator Rha-like protein